MEQQKVDLDALEAALAKATPGEWTVEMDGPDDDDSPCDVVIPEINRILHSTEWADPEDFEQDVANAEAIVAAHNALPALIAELRQLRARITPEVIGEKHRDGNWWLVGSRFASGGYRADGANVRRCGSGPTMGMSLLLPTRCPCRPRRSGSECS